jgi:hypothetical protein
MGAHLDLDDLVGGNDAEKLELHNLRWSRAEAEALVLAHEGRIERLQAELDALRKDAERYRFLRDARLDWWEATIIRLYSGPEYDRKSGAELDEVVDTAMHYAAMLATK